MMLQKSLRAAASVALAVLVLGCGGAGGSGATAGINGGGRWVATGSVAGFGSVIVNGVRFDTTGATVTVNGNAATEGALATGLVVRVEGRSDTGGLGSRAFSIVHDTSVRGPVQQVQASSRRLVVLGQPVIVTVDTVLAGPGMLTGIEDFTPGQSVSVSGYANAADELVATRIAVETAGAEFAVLGSVDAVEAAQRRFRINDLVVDYSSAVLQGFAGQDPIVGNTVQVRGTTLAGGVLAAANVARRDAGVSAQTGDVVDVEGLITRFASATDFDVANQRIVTTAATQFTRGSSQSLAINAFVDVQGSRNAAGELAATRIEFLPVSNIQLEATLESINPATGVLRLVGIDVVTNLRTRFDDDDNRTFGLADLRTGDSLEIAGYVDGGRLVATRVSRDDDGGSSEVEIEGPATDLAAPQFRVGTVLISTDGQTEFEGDAGSIGSAEFFATGAGRRVEVEGQWNGAAVLAEEVEFED